MLIFSITVLLPVRYWNVPRKLPNPVGIIFVWFIFSFNRPSGQTCEKKSLWENILISFLQTHRKQICVHSALEGASNCSYRRGSLSASAALNSTQSIAQSMKISKPELHQIFLSASLFVYHRTNQVNFISAGFLCVLCQKIKKLISYSHNYILRSIHSLCV